jgi:hypothetical protein
MNTHLARLGRVVFVTLAVCLLTACANVLGYIDMRQMARNVTSWKAELPLLEAMLKNCEDQARAGQRDAAELRQCRAAYTARYRKAEKEIAAGEFYRACLAASNAIAEDEDRQLDEAGLGNDTQEFLVWAIRTREREETCVAALTAARGEAEAEYEAAGSPDFPLGADLRELREQLRAEVAAEYTLCMQPSFRYPDRLEELRDECGANRDRDLRNVEAMLSARSPTVTAGLSPLSSDATPATPPATTTAAGTQHGPVAPPGFVACPGKPNVFIPNNAPIGVCNSL